MVVRAQPGLVGEVHRRTFGFGLGADGRELLVFPALDYTYGYDLDSGQLVLYAACPNQTM